MTMTMSSGIYRPGGRATCVISPDRGNADDTNESATPEHAEGGRWLR